MTEQYGGAGDAQPDRPRAGIRPCRPRSTRAQRAAVGAAILLLSGVLAAAFALVNTVHGIDLRVYYEAGKDVLSGTALYDTRTGAGGDGSGGGARVPFTYPPFAALLAVPLGLVSWGVLQWLWSALTIAALAVVVALAYAPLFRAYRIGRGRAVLAVAALTAAWAGSGPVTDHLGFGQVGVFLMAVCLLDADPHVRLPRWLPRGVLTGCAGAVKLVPVAYLVRPVLPAPLQRRRWRSVVAGAVAFLACTFAAFAVLPGDTIAYLADAVPHLSERVGVGDPSVHGNQSLRGMLLRTLPDGVSAATVDALWLALCAGVIVGAVWAARRAQISRGPMAGLVVLALAVEVVMPVSWTHHYVWTVPAVGLLLMPVASRGITIASRVVAAVLVVAAFARTAPLVASSSPGLPVLDALGTEAILLSAVLAVVALGFPAPSRCGAQGTSDVRGHGTTRAGRTAERNFLAAPVDGDLPAGRSDGNAGESSPGGASPDSSPDL